MDAKQLHPNNEDIVVAEKPIREIRKKISEDEINVLLELIKEWKDIYNVYKDKLVPNKKEALEIIEYLKYKYSIEEIDNPKIENIVYDNIVLNEYYKNKLDGKNPIIRLFEVKDKKLYYIQVSIFKNNKKYYTN